MIYLVIREYYSINFKIEFSTELAVLDSSSGRTLKLIVRPRSFPLNALLIGEGTFALPDASAVDSVE